MKNFFKGLGKAFLYAMAYLVPQFSVSILFIFGYVFIETAKQTAAGDAINQNLLVYQAQLFILNNTGWILIVSAVVTLLIYLLVALIRKKNFFKTVNINKMKPLGIVPIVILAMAFNLLLNIVLSYIPFPQAWMDSYIQTSEATLGGGGIALLIAAVIVAPILEEVVFRGFIYQRLKSGMPLVVAAILTSFAFGVVHGTIIWGIYTFVFSLLLIWTYERFHSLLANIILHMFFNLAGELIGTYAEQLNKLGDIALAVIGLVGTVLPILWILKMTKKETEDVTIEAGNVKVEAATSDAEE